jgi:prepilin-type N-terminal cleavage/methylation domain-containing protein
MQTTRDRRRRGQQGLSLIEVLVAMSVLGVGLLAMLAMQLHAMRGGQAGRHVTDAAQVAQDRMEIFQRIDWDDAALADTGGWVLGGDVQTRAVQGGAAGNVPMNYNVDWRITDDPVNPKLRLVDVRVTWYELDDPPLPAPPRRRYAISSIRFDDNS